MTGFMDRSCFEPGGFAYEFRKAKGIPCEPLPRNVAGIQLGVGRHGQDSHPLTWEEIHQARRKKQAERLEQLRRTTEAPLLPCYVWTFFNRQEIPYHGWYCYLVTRHFQQAVNFRGFNHHLAVSLMEEIPLGMLPLPENFRGWMAEFARQYPRRKIAGDPRKAGVAFGWLSNRCTFSRTKPTPKSEIVNPKS
jgi:hypothetical protein